MKKKEKQIKNAIKGILLIVFYLGGFIPAFLKAIFQIGKLTTKTATLLNFFATLIFAIFLLILYKKELKKEWIIFKKNMGENLDIGIKYWLIGLLLMMVSNIAINLILKTGIADNEQAVQKMITSLPWIMLLSAGVIAPFNEEILFRKCFRDTFTNNTIFILTSGIIFGLLHVSTAETLSQFIYILPYSFLGFSFALMYTKTKSVFTSMSMHMAHNTLLTLVSIFI